MSTGEIRLTDLEGILGTNEPYEVREGLVRAALEASGVIEDDTLRKELSKHGNKINDGIGHWSDLAVIIESIPHARGDAGPGFGTVDKTGTGSEAAGYISYRSMYGGNGIIKSRA